MPSQSITPYEKRLRHVVRTLIENGTSEGCHRDTIVTTITMQQKCKVSDVHKALTALTENGVIEVCGGMGTRFRKVVRS